MAKFQKAYSVQYRTTFTGLAGQGYGVEAFTLDWTAQQARCPQGHTSVKWTPGHDMRGGPVVRIRFDTATCRACTVRSACTWAKEAPRQLTVRPHEQHMAMQAARQRQETPEFKAQYAPPGGGGEYGVPRDTAF
jgi:transposase